MFLGSRLSAINHAPARSFISPVDGRVRHEIDDSGSALLMDEDQILYYAQRHKPVPVVSCLYHPPLMCAYPEIQQMPVVFNSNMRGAALTRSPETLWRLHIGLAGPREDAPPQPEQAHTNLLHELQHVVQAVEGHPFGTILPTEIEHERQRRLHRLENIAKGHPPDSLANRRVKRQIDALTSQHGPQEKLLCAKAHRRYLCTPGEIEAYDTEARREMTVRERQQLPSAIELFAQLSPRAALRELRAASRNYTCMPQFGPAPRTDSLRDDTTSRLAARLQFD